MSLLTVVLPNFNHARHLPETIESIMSQMDHGLELLVMDDGSTDESFSIIEAYARRYPAIRVFRNESNQGVHATVNKCLELATGTFIYFAAADDRVLPGFFSQSVAMLLAHPCAALCTCPIRYINDDGVPVAPWLGPRLRNRSYITAREAQLLLRRYGFWLPGTGTVLRLDRTREAKGFDGAIGYMADSYLAQELALRYGFCALPDTMVEMRLIPSSYSCTERVDIAKTQVVRSNTVIRMRQAPELFPLEFVRDWESLWEVLDSFRLWQGTVLRGQKELLRHDSFVFRSRQTWSAKVIRGVLYSLSLFQFFIFAISLGLPLIGNPLIRPYLTWTRLFYWVRKHCRIESLG